MNSKRSLKAKLITSSLIMVAIFMVIGAIAIISLVKVSDHYRHVAQINLNNTKLLAEMNHASAEATRNYLRIPLPQNTPEVIRAILQDIQKNIEEYQRVDKAYQEVPFVPGEQELYEAQNNRWLAYHEEVKNLVAAVEAKKTAEYMDLIQNSMAKLRIGHSNDLRKLIDFQNAESAKWVAEAESMGKTANTITVSCIVCGSIVILAFGFAFSRSLSNDLRNVTKQIADAGSQVGTASEQLSTASQQLSSGATQAASALEETVASIEELASMVKLNAANAKEASVLSLNSRQSAEEGEIEIRKLNEAVNEIAQSSKRIEEIINVIDDIAFQTNLLALNAAVEAARAGEQGKGFAVVAEAVRNLAQRSSSAAKDITTLIKDSVDKIERGSKIADEGGKVLRNIVGSVKKVSDLNNEIASASEEQPNGLSQISKAMTELDQATQRNASSAEETAAASTEMSGQAINLRNLVEELTVVVEGDGQPTGSNRRSPSMSVATHQSGSGQLIGFNAAASKKGVRRPTPHHKSTTSGSLAQNVIPFDSENVPDKVGTTDGF